MHTPLGRSASEQRGNTLQILSTMNRELRPESGLDCLICAILLRGVRGMHGPVGSLAGGGGVHTPLGSSHSFHWSHCTRVIVSRETRMLGGHATRWTTTLSSKTNFPF